MNKVVNINLGGIPFTLDEDAYVHLQKYLDTIHRHFAQNEGYREITRDIEARLAELFQERLDRRSIVNLNDVEEAIAIMGKPEDFGAAPMEEGRADKQQSFSGSYKTGKRLFRNTDDEVVGGVCSGISAYFGIQDPIWIRLLFVVLTLSGAFGIPIYIILWILMPQAKTAGDKLAMRGNPSTFRTSVGSSRKRSTPFRRRCPGFPKTGKNSRERALRDWVASCGGPVSSSVPCW